jgi:hypothetical protein
MNQSGPTLEICGRLGLLPSGPMTSSGQAADELALAEAGA